MSNTKRTTTKRKPLKEGKTSFLVIITSDINEWVDEDSRAETEDGSFSIEMFSDELEARARFVQARMHYTTLFADGRYYNAMSDADRGSARAHARAGSRGARLRSQDASVLDSEESLRSSHPHRIR
jgi:hypothetical protein